MGLDMFLMGEVDFLYNCPNTPEFDNHKVDSLKIELAYWRKQPNLHGYIVEAFAAGQDNCEPICLLKEDLLQIIDALESNALPETTGFFFGEHDNSEEQKAKDIETFKRAIEWLNTETEGVWRTVHYQASW